MTHMIPLMIVPLLVWVAVWAYLTSLDSKVKKLEREVAKLEAQQGAGGQE